MNLAGNKIPRSVWIAGILGVLLIAAGSWLLFQ